MIGRMNGIRTLSWHMARLGLLALTVSMVTACGDENSSIPTPEDLSNSLVTDEDLDGEWTVNLGPDDREAAIDPSGVVREDQRDLLPTIDLCDRASDSSREAVRNLRPLAFRQLDLSVDDPIDPPFDREGHLVFAQEFLYAGETEIMKETFAEVRQGLLSCLGDIPAGEEGPGTAETLEVPEVGDDRVGVLTTISEAGSWAEWVIHQVLVLEGSTLLSLVVVDIRAGEGTEPYFSADDFGDILRIAVNKL